MKFLSTLDDPTSGIKALEKLSASVRSANRNYRGFNLFDAEDLRLFEVLLHYESLRKTSIWGTAPSTGRDTSLLAGAIVDLENGSIAGRIEAQRRITSSLSLEIESRFFTNVAEGSLLRTVSQDSYAVVRVGWSF